jgi:hypothetical protein
MRYFLFSIKCVIFQLVLVLLGSVYVFGGAQHISGVVQGNSNSTIAHISGIANSESLPSIKNHVSGAKKVFVHKEYETIEVNIREKAKKLGITLGTSEKINPTQAKKK